MEQYVDNGITYNVAANRLQDFLKDHPNATKVSSADTVEAPSRAVSRRITRSSPRSEQKEQPETQEEDTLIERTFGKFFVTDYLGDLYRATQQGFAQGATVDEALDVFKKGKNISDEELKRYIEVADNLQKAGVSDEMLEYEKIKEEAGGGVWGFMKGMFLTRGQIIPQVIVSSAAGMARTFFDSEEAAAATGSFALAGGTAGSFIPGVGNVTGAIGGAVAGLTGSMETALTLTELLREELGDKEFNEKNIRAILENQKVYEDITDRALARGATIGAVEALTVGLARGVGSKLLTKGASKREIAAKVTGIEMAGGATGEALGQLAARQEFDIAEVLLEGVAETKGLVNVSDILAKKTYEINGEQRTRKEVLDKVNNMKPESLAKVQFDITGDKNLDNFVRQKQSEAVFKTQIDARVAETDRNRLVELEKARLKAKADTEKKGIFKVIDADANLKKIEADINGIIDKYKDVDITDTEVQAREKTAKEVRDFRISKTIAFAEAEGKKIGKETVIVDNNEQAQATFDKLREEYNRNITDPAKKIQAQNVENSDAFIVGDSIIINKDIAGRTGAINVGAHEVLHGVLAKHMQSLDTAGKKKLISSFKNVLSKKQLAAITKRLEDNYKDEIAADPDFMDTTDEWFTAFSDAIEKNEITFDEGVFDKIKNAIQEILRKFNIKKDFENGRQAYNFLKDYSASIKKNQLSSRAIALAGEGATITETKKSISAKAKQAQGTIDKIGKKATTKAEYDAGVNIEAYNYLIENKGLDGLILAELVKRGIDVKAEDANVNGQPLRFYLEDVRAKLIPDVLGFNPDKEVTSEGKFGLSGHINKRLKFRMGDVATKAKKTVTGKSIETPIGETGRTIAETIEDEGDARLKAFEEQNLSVSAQNRAIETQQDKNELKSRYRHKLKNADGTKLITEDRVENIREGIRSTLIKLADKVVSLDFLFNFEKIVKKDLKNIVQKAIGTKKQYFEFVSKNMADIVDFTSVQDLVALERLVGQGKLKGGKKIFTVAVRRLTKVEDIQKAINQGKLPVDAINKSKEGVMLYEKRMPTQEELEAFFFGTNMQEVLGYKLGASTLGTRKDGLSRMIITELSQDGLMEVMQEPAIMEKLLAKQPEIASEVMVNDVATKINRSPSLKFSKTQIKKGISILNKGRGLESNAYKAWAKTVTPEIRGLVEDKYLRRQFEIFLQSDDVIPQKELDAIDKNLDQEIPLHRKYEIIAGQRLQKIIDDAGLKFKVLKPSEKDKDQDVRVIDANGKVVLAIEIKGDTARAISININSKKNGNIVAVQDLYGDQQQKILDKVKDLFEDMKNVAISTYGKNAVQYSSSDNLQISYEAVQQAIRGGNNIHFKAHNIKENITFKQVADAYQTKKSKDGSFKKSHAIDFKGKGLIDMNMSEAGLKIEGLTKAEDINVKIPLKFRFDFKLNAAKTYYTISGRIEPQLTAYDLPSQKASLLNKKDNKNILFSKSITKDVSVANNLIKASRSNMSKTKGASIFDFDETVGISENFVIATKEGITKRIPSEQWPLVGETLKEEGYTFDFTDFNKVTKGRPGPLLQKMKNQIKKYGSKNVFILTARAPESQQAIHDWLKSEGVNIPIENITGLGDSTAEAKANWVLDKYANKGYNDIYFVDDALQNVQAVQNMFDQLDIKGKSVQARIKFSKSIDTQFNDILEDVAGIESEKRFSDVKARKRGANKGKFRFFIPPSHEDFVGLLYNFIGKGRQGDRHRNFFEEALIKPLNKAYRELNTARQSIANDYKSLNKAFSDVKSILKEKTPDGDFTYEDAIRVYLWNKHAYNIPGLSDTDKAYLANLVLSDPELQAYAEQINIISKQDAYVNPTESWEVGDIRTDLDAATGRVGREQFFVKFFENADIIFSKENLNKIEAIYGAEMVGAIKDILYRTKTGRNRPSGQNKLVNEFLNYLNGSVAATMFFNIRSSVLQQMSIVNFINFADNNIYAAAKAFANQSQYWKDFTFLFNSDFMKQRRGGIMTDVDGAELAASVQGAVNPVRAAMKKLLQLGFLPTQIGDNIAIATGGATFYRNRLNTYLKEGFTQKEAQEKAFEDFQILAEATQQSARPDMVSQQQASTLGRLILAFQNVTSQFNRLGKKAFLDLKNRRKTPGNPTQLQSDLSNISRMTYYFVIQNLIFYSLQSALFAMMFDDDEEDERFLKKKERAIQGSIDSVLRGAGVWGAVAATLKNMAIKYSEQRKKKYNKDESAVLMEMLNVSPPLGIKARKIVNAEKTLNYNREVIKEMEFFDIDNPMWSAVTNYIEATTNFPANRLLNKTINVRDAFTAKTSAFFRALMFSGWSKWNLGIEDEKRKKIKEQIKRKKEQEKKTNTRRKIRRKIRR